MTQQITIPLALLEQLVGALDLAQALLESSKSYHHAEALAAYKAARAARANAERVERKPIFTTGHCKEKQKPGGCQLHNLQCGYPKCDRGPTIDLGRYAGTYGGYIKKEQP